MFKNIIISVLLSIILIGGAAAKKSIDTLHSALLTLQIKHKKDLIKVKIKERGKRLLVAIPIAGMAAATYFEAREFQEWQLDNPNGTLTEYLAEIKDAAYDVGQDFIIDYCSEDGSYCDFIESK